MCAHAVIARRYGVYRTFEAPALRTAITMILRTGWPVGLQQGAVYAGGNVFLLIVAPPGTAYLALGQIVNAFLVVGIVICAGFGVTAATFVGQALGRGQVDDARMWGWEVARIGAAVMAVLGCIGAVAAAPVLRMFLADPQLWLLGVVPFRLLMAAFCLDAFGRILGYSLRGAGATKTVTATAFLMQWCVNLPCSWAVGVLLGFGFNGIMVVHIGVTAVEVAVLSIVWWRGGWARVLDRIEQRAG